MPESENQSARSADLSVPESTLPAWMREDERVGTEELGKYQNQSRLALVQPQSGQDLKALGAEGTVLLQPDGIVVAPPESEFVIIPIAFWVSWEIHSDIDDTASNYVLESTMDENSEIAKRSRDPQLREEAYGNNFTRKYVECLNFAIRIDSGDAKGEMGVLTFSGGEHRVGRKLSGVLNRRPASIFGNRIALSTARRTKDRYNWFGFEINNPSEGGAIVQTQEEYEALKEMHAEFVRALRSGQVTMAADPEDAESGASASGEDAGGHGDLPPM